MFEFEVERFEFEVEMTEFEVALIAALTTFITLQREQESVCKAASKPWKKKK
jgi:hypothetical protein